MAVANDEIYTGWTEAELLAARRKAQIENAAGKMTSAAGAGDVSKSSLIQKNPLERIKEINYALYTLYLQDSVTYAAYANLGDSFTSWTVGTFA